MGVGVGGGGVATIGGEGMRWSIIGTHTAACAHILSLPNLTSGARTGALKPGSIKLTL